jgi:hypothetical protein
VYPCCKGLDKFLEKLLQPKNSKFIEASSMFAWAYRQAHRGIVKLIQVHGNDSIKISVRMGCDVWIVMAVSIATISFIVLPPLMSINHFPVQGLVVLYSMSKRSLG